ncbi:hypothetical protein D3C83_192030 [compost metagenome]
MFGVDFSSDGDKRQIGIEKMAVSQSDEDVRLFVFDGLDGDICFDFNAARLERFCHERSDLGPLRC